MKITRNGITYDTDADKELCGVIQLDPDNSEDRGDRQLFRTEGGHFYLCNRIRQVLVDGDWRTCNDCKDLPGFGVHTLPSPRVRRLHTITPITIREAYRLTVLSVLPEEFHAAALRGLPS